MIDNIANKSIKLFVFGTLRTGGRLDYYMEGSKYAGMFYAQGQLMKSEIGSAYIDFNEKEAATIGELHYVNFPSLLRIDHLETTSGEFPKGYDLDLIPIWNFDPEKKATFEPEAESYAFFYRRRNDPVKVIGGDWVKQAVPVEEIKRFLTKNTEYLYDSEELINHMLEYLNLKRK